MVTYTRPDKWVPVDGMELEKAALDVVCSNINNLVIAGPGAGKTELLAQRACYLLQTNISKYPRNILAISFKKDAAENLRERVEKRCGKELSRRFLSKTYDSFAKNLIDRFMHSIPKDYKPNSNYEIATQTRSQNDVRKAFDLSGLPPKPGINDSERNKTLNKVLVDSPLPIEQNSAANLLVKKVWELMLNGHQDLSPCLTFPMISRLAEYIIRTNPLIKMSLQHTYSHVFLDEFQDTTYVQYDLLKTCFYNSKAVITAVGDSKQRIMIWAGAKKDVFDIYVDEFSSKQETLIMNHRSAPRLVEIQKTLYKRFNQENETIKTNTKWNEDDGEAYLWLFENHEQEAFILAKNISSYLALEKLNPSDICILVKQTPDDYTNLLIKALKSYGIKARNEGTFQDFLKEDCVKICLNMLTYATIKIAPEEWSYINETLLQLRGYDKHTPIERMLQIQKMLKNLSCVLLYKLNNAKSEKDVFEVIRTIITFCGVKSLKNLFPQYKRGSHLNTTLGHLASYLWREFIQEKSWPMAINNIKGVNSLPIMTIHKSKGLEYDTIIFLGLEDSAFWSYYKQPDEDTCTFFVALSRAKKRLIFTYCHSRQIGSRYTSQSREMIDDFYEILKNSGVVEEMNFSNHKLDEENANIG